MIRVEHLTKTYGRPGTAAAADDRRRAGARRRVVRGRARRDRRPAGAERRRQDHADADPDRLPGAHARRRPCSPAARSPSDTRAVRRALGYLPEAVPLLPRDARRASTSASAPRCKGDRARRAAARPSTTRSSIAGLGDRRTQIIGTLSRGYRQRVGPGGRAAGAAADPDPRRADGRPGPEPDPRDARADPRARRASATVLLSTHILSEVEALAARVVILHAGAWRRARRRCGALAGRAASSTRCARRVALARPRSARRAGSAWAPRRPTSRWRSRPTTTPTTGEAVFAPQPPPGCRCELTASLSLRRSSRASPPEPERA